MIESQPSPPPPEFPGLAFREPTEEDIPRLVELSNAIWPEWYRTNEEETRFYWQPFDAQGRTARVIGETQGRLVANASLRGTIRGNPDDSGGTSIDIPVDWRRRGVGTVLYRYLEDVARGWGLRILWGWSTSALEGGEEFLTKMGFTITNRGSESQLDLATANYEPFARRARELREAGYEFFTLAERDSPDMRGQAHELSNYIDREMPTDGTPPPESSYEAWEKHIYGGNPGYGPRQVHLAAMDGRLAGMTALYYQPSGCVYTTTTGVRGEHRGKGVAGALKFHSLTQALADGKKVAMTENSTRNAPMLAINRKLGYKHAQETVEFEKKLV